MSERNILPNVSELSQMETDALYKESEPDANEIMFGQKTLPDRPLTMRETSKRKKIIMKLVDQKLKFKLIEMMRLQVANNEQEQARKTATTTRQTLNDSQLQSSFPDTESQKFEPNRMSGPPSQSHYQSQRFPYYGEHTVVGGNWQQQWQPPVHPPQYGTVVNASWNAPHIRPFTQPYMQPNVQHNFNPINFPVKRKGKPISNPNNKRPVISSTNVVNTINKDRPVVSNAFGSVQEHPNTKIQPFRSSLIEVNCNLKSQTKADAVIEPPVTNQSISTVAVADEQQNGKQIAVPISTVNQTTAEKPVSKSQRKRQRKKELKKQIQAAATASGNVILRDKFDSICVTETSNVPTDSADSLWNELNSLATSIFRKEVNQSEPLSLDEQKFYHKFRIQMSTNPDTLRSDRILTQFLTNNKIAELITKVKMLLRKVERGNPQVQRDFSALKESVISELKTLNDDAVNANGTENDKLIKAKVYEVIEPLLSPDMDETARDKLLSKVIANPRTLETIETIPKGTTTAVDVMQKIKNILDEFMIVRPGKRFYIPIQRSVDVPFIVALHDRSGKISDENATKLREALTTKMESVVSLTKPKIIDPKLTDGSLVMVCANGKTFNLIKTTIAGDFDGKWLGADLTVMPVELKNPLARSELKTVLMKFAEPQYYHFNHLMEQLKIDNPRLLVRRWELHQPPAGTVVDSTKCLYVGVDLESLGIIEQMDRVAVLVKSTVTFDICYEQTERNYLPDQTFLAANRKNKTN